jgi:hypothetical protein
VRKPVKDERSKYFTHKKIGRVEDCLEQYKPTMMLSGIPARQPEEPAVT